MFESPGGLDPAVRDAYLARLGVEAGSPSAEALFSLVRRHAERVPYETLWIAAGERWTIDPGQAARRIAFAGRGGYCYHLNGALGLLLRSLGYTVHGHVGGVHGVEAIADEWGNHLVLTVSELPSHNNPSGQWYVDAGLGDALHEPLPLVPGAYVQNPFRLTLEHLIDDTWQLTHDPAGGFGKMTWTTAAATLSDFAAKHEWLSTSSESGFVQVPMAERRDRRARGRLRPALRRGAARGAPSAVGRRPGLAPRLGGTPAVVMPMPSAGAAWRSGVASLSLAAATPGGG